MAAVIRPQPSPTTPMNGDFARSQSPDLCARGGANAEGRVAHTLTACSRCRKRKSRCDPGLPSCHPCARTNAVCEYFDAAKGRMMPRTYIVNLQEQVKLLEKELADLDTDSKEESDPEALVRDATVVRLASTDERKYLGPSSGTGLTRIIMQLAKRVVGVSSIDEIVSSDQARMVQETRELEESKPTSKDVDYLYPLTSQTPNPELPSQELAMTLIRLYNIKVQTMYPLLHEPSLTQWMADVYNGVQDPFRNFVTRMVLAIALQRGHTRLAGLGDSFYLAAMTWFEAVVQPMDLQTLQCFVLIGQYSLLTPTRTAVFYVVGLAVRLAQKLGITEERTLTKNRDGSQATAYETDMRRRVFWAVVTMDYGLAHSLGRPAIMATGANHIDVGFFQPIDDQCITSHGFLPGAFSTRKWIAIHFYKMRMLQLEIRRTLYQKKRATPQNEDDPWFVQMKAKMDDWRDASPNNDENSGFSKEWFQGRYNTMIVMLYRPSPQIPRPSGKAAVQCYQAAEFNIYMQRNQIETKSVELTWIFTQTIFSCVNTILWSLSYAEVRRMRTREDVEQHLNVAVEAIRLASERWPGVYAALELYQILIRAILLIFDKEGDVAISAASPFESEWSSSPNADGDSIMRSQNSTPSSYAMPFEGAVDPPLFPQEAVARTTEYHQNRAASPHATRSDAASTTSNNGHLSPEYRPQMHHESSPATSYTSEMQAQMPRHFTTPMPSTYMEMGNWNFASATQHHQPGVLNDTEMFGIGPLVDAARRSSAATITNHDSNQNWLAQMSRNEGLSRAQQEELLQGLETQRGHEELERQIQASNAFIFKHVQQRG